MPTPNLPENTALIATDPVTAGMLSGMNTTLSELHPLASKIADLKKETLEKEASILKAILDKLTQLVPLLSDDYDQCYRREIVILTREERIPIENGSGFFSEHRLILYENGLLARTHRYGEWSEGLHPGWEIIDEEELTPEAAILAFGLTAISEGLMKVLGKASSIAILKGRLEGRIAALAKILENYEAAANASE